MTSNSRINHSLCYEVNQLSPKILKKVNHAWEKVVKKGKRLGKRSCGLHESYRLWLYQRVQKVKLPLHSSTSIIEETPIKILVSVEEFEELKVVFTKSKRKGREFEDVHHKVKMTQEENSHKKLSLEEADERAQVAEE